jgi:prophage antirepressor-like protein
MSALKTEDIQPRIILVRGESVLLDADVAAIYGVATKEVNQAVANNPDKFPEGYILELSTKEKQEVVKKFDHLKSLKFSPHLPKAFSEKGLYMLATIIKSAVATETTLSIIETFSKIRHLSKTLRQLTESDKEPQQKALMQKSGEIIAEVIGNELSTTNTETTVEFNVAFLKVKHTVTRKKDEKSKEQ